MPKIRHAVPEDAPEIVEIVRDVWQESIDAVYCHDLIDAGPAVVRVAVIDGEVGGFVAGFPTVGQDDAARWEVDLLAVKTTCQGRRLGQHLVESAWEDALSHGVEYARALIAVDNIASQLSFERAGYCRDSRIYEMYLWSPLDSEGSPETSSGFTGSGKAPALAIPVDTLAYRGLWLEGLSAPELSNEERRVIVAQARTLIYHEGRKNTGALIPEDIPLQAELRDAARINGRYQWWTRTQ